MKHRRKVYPMPSGQVWKMGCNCGWEGSIDLAGLRDATAGDVQELLNDQFVGHLPKDGRQSYVLIDQRPGQEGNWLMPEGVPCYFEHWHQDGELFYADLLQPVAGRFPVGEIRCETGETLRLE